MTDENITVNGTEAVTVGATKLISASTPRVQRSEGVEPGHYFTIKGEMCEDGLARLLMPKDVSDEEFQAGVEAMEEHDRQLEALRKVSQFVESFEDDEEIIARCYSVPSDQITVTYKKRGDTGWSTGHVSNESGEGIDKFSGVPIVVKFIQPDEPTDDDDGEYVQVDPWTWSYSVQYGWQRL